MTPVLAFQYILAVAFGLVMAGVICVASYATFRVILHRVEKWVSK